MVRSSLTQVTRTAGRGIQSARITRIASPKIGATPIIPKLSVGLPVSIANATSRCISTSGVKRVPITTPDGKPAQDSETPKVARTPANITDSEYHSVADEYLERLLTHLEDIQDVREDVEVEFSAGVLTVKFGPEVGTYVINKQPPNKQIWLSSPKSGPKRYDYVILGDSQHEKQETAAGEWIYLRDGSTIHELFKNELDIDISMPTGTYGVDID